MKKIIASTFLLTGLLMSPLHAATVNTVTCEVPEAGIADLCITGVDGVEINGTTYNVEFVFDTFANLNVGDNFPFYPTFGGPGDASVAVDAINLVINTSGTAAQRIIGGGPNNPQIFYEVAKQASAGPFINTSRGIIGNPFVNSTFNRTNGVVAIEGVAPHAVFTVVPIPAAAWLFFSALAGLGCFRRLAR